MIDMNEIIANNIAILRKQTDLAEVYGKQIACFLCHCIQVILQIVSLNTIRLQSGSTYSTRRNLS